MCSCVCVYFLKSTIQKGQGQYTKMNICVAMSYEDLTHARKKTDVKRQSKVHAQYEVYLAATNYTLQ